MRLCHTSSRRRHRRVALPAFIFIDSFAFAVSKSFAEAPATRSSPRPAFLAPHPQPIYPSIYLSIRPSIHPRSKRLLSGANSNLFTARLTSNDFKLRFILVVTRHQYAPRSALLPSELSLKSKPAGGPANGRMHPPDGRTSVRASSAVRLLLRNSRQRPPLLLTCAETRRKSQALPLPGCPFLPVRTTYSQSVLPILCSHACSACSTTDSLDDSVVRGNPPLVHFHILRFWFNSSGGRLGLESTRAKLGRGPVGLTGSKDDSRVWSYLP